jgi:hypothetical protein
MLHNLLKTCFHDWDATGIKHVNFGAIDIHADNIMAYRV